MPYIETSQGTSQEITSVSTDAPDMPNMIDAIKDSSLDNDTIIMLVIVAIVVLYLFKKIFDAIYGNSSKGKGIFHSIDVYAIFLQDTISRLSDSINQGNSNILLKIALKNAKDAQENLQVSYSKFLHNAKSQLREIINMNKKFPLQKNIIDKIINSYKKEDFSSVVSLFNSLEQSNERFYSLVAVINYHRGVLYQREYHYSKAMNNFKLAAAQDAESLKYKQSLAGFYVVIEQHKEAIDRYLSLLDNMKKHNSMEGAETVYNNLGSSYLNIKDYKNAKEYLKLAYKVLVQKYGENHKETQIVRNNLNQLKSKS